MEHLSHYSGSVRKTWRESYTEDCQGHVTEDWKRIIFRGLHNGNLSHLARECSANTLIGRECSANTLIGLSVNRTQSRVVTDLLTGHNTPKRHLYIIGLIDSPLCRRCGVEEETSARIFCECESLATLRHNKQFRFLFLRP